MWPFICQFLGKLFRETIELTVWAANAQLSTFSFTKVNVCQQFLRVNGVYTGVYTEKLNRRKSILNLQICFVENCEDDLEIKQYFCRVGVIHGTMWVILETLIGWHAFSWSTVHLLPKETTFGNYLDRTD